ncbi:hypothetical protein RLIN73S_05298 [Rhodanobacter lindaniclasticus]
MLSVLASIALLSASNHFMRSSTLPSLLPAYSAATFCFSCASLFAPPSHASSAGRRCACGNTT